MNTATEAWMEQLRLLKFSGQYVAPRGLDTAELLASQTDFYMDYPVVRSAARKLSYQFMAAEAYFIISGDDRVEGIAPFAPRIANFSDDGLYFFGAYGPRLHSQWNHVIDSLVTDNVTRQCVATTWRPNPHKGSKDVPCTVSLQWMLRDGHLHCVDNMRSSDIWLGWPYDVFNFSMFSACIMFELRKRGVDCVLGKLFLHAGSSHLYLSNLNTVNKCLEEPVSEDYRFPYEKFSSSHELIAFLKSVATCTNKARFPQIDWV